MVERFFPVPPEFVSMNIATGSIPKYRCLIPFAFAMTQPSACLLQYPVFFPFSRVPNCHQVAVTHLSHRGLMIVAEKWAPRCRLEIYEGARASKIWFLVVGSVFWLHPILAHIVMNLIWMRCRESYRLTKLALHNSDYCRSISRLG